MSKRTATWLAWSMWALSLTLTALSLLLLLVQTLSYPDVLIFAHWLDGTLLAINFSTVGAVCGAASLTAIGLGRGFIVITYIGSLSRISRATGGGASAGYS